MYFTDDFINYVTTELLFKRNTCTTSSYKNIYKHDFPLINITLKYLIKFLVYNLSQFRRCQFNYSFVQNFCLIIIVKNHLTFIIIFLKLKQKRLLRLAVIYSS